MNELRPPDEPVAGGTTISEIETSRRAGVDAVDTRPWSPLRSNDEATPVTNERRAPSPADPGHVLRAMLELEPTDPSPTTGRRRMASRGKRALSAIRSAATLTSPVGTTVEPAPATSTARYPASSRAEKRPLGFARSVGAPVTEPLTDGGTDTWVDAGSAQQHDTEARTHDTIGGATTMAADISAGLDRRQPAAITDPTPSDVAHAPQGIHVRALADKVSYLTQQMAEQSVRFETALAQAREDARRRVDAQRAQYDDDVAALTAQHERELGTRSVTVAQQLSTQDEQHAQAMAALEAEYLRVLAERDSRHEQSIKDLVAEHEQALEEQATHEVWSHRLQREQHAQTVEALVAMHDKSVGALRRHLATEQLRSAELARRLASE